MRAARSKHTGAAALEAAIVLPVMVLMLLFLVQGGIAIFRSNQVTTQAREAARYASVHGGDWARETKKKCPTQAEIVSAAVTPLAQSMDTANLTCTIEWIEEATGNAVAWDSATHDVASTDANSRTMTNRVRVTVTYRSTGVFLLGTLTFKSVSELPMSF